MQTITSFARKIAYMPFNCITSLIFRDIKTVSLKNEELDRLCMPIFIDTHKITVEYYKQPYEEQRAYVDAYKQVVEMQNLVIADLEQRLKIANNVINGYERLSCVEYPIEYGFIDPPRIYTVEYIDLSPVDYYFGDVKVSCCRGKYTFECDTTIKDVNIDIAVSIKTCDCPKLIQKENIQLHKVKDTLPKVKEDITLSVIITTEPKVELTTDDDSSEDIVKDCDVPQSEPEPQAPRLGEVVYGPDDEDSFTWTPQVSEEETPQLKTIPVYVVGLEYKTPEEKEEIAKSKNTTVEYLHPIHEKPNICKLTKSYVDNNFKTGILSNIQPMDVFVEYSNNLSEGKTHFASDVPYILTLIYDKLAERDNLFSRWDVPENITTLYYYDDCKNKVWKSYTTRIALTFNVPERALNYYVKLEIVTQDGKEHDSSNNVADTFKFYVYNY